MFRFEAFLEVLIFLTVFLICSVRGAPEGFTHIASNSEEGLGLFRESAKGKTEYFLSDDSAEWNTAYVRCQESMLGGSLVAIRSEAEMTTIRNSILVNLPLPATIWTSGMNDGNNWIWATDETQNISPQWWGPGFPGSTNEFVDLYVTGPLTSQRKLRTGSGATRHRYICEAIRGDDTTTTPQPTTTVETTPEPSTTIPGDPPPNHCGEHLDSISGEIIHKAGEHYEQNEICTWLITSSSKNVIQFQVLEEGMTSYARLILYSPSDYGDMQLLKKIYRGDSAKYEYIGSVFLVIFISGKSSSGLNNGTGFRLAYSFIDTTNPPELTFKSYYFRPSLEHTPNLKFPPNENIYSPNTLYTAVYSAPLNYTVSFQAGIMDIEPKCNNDKLTFYYFDPYFRLDLYDVVRICNGETVGLAMGSNPFIVTFRTNKVISGNGFYYSTYIHPQYNPV